MLLFLIAFWRAIACPWPIAFMSSKSVSLRVFCLGTEAHRRLQGPLVCTRLERSLSPHRALQAPGEYVSVRPRSSLLVVSHTASLFHAITRTYLQGLPDGLVVRVLIEQGICICHGKVVVWRRKPRSAISKNYSHQVRYNVGCGFEIPATPYTLSRWRYGFRLGRDV